MVERRVANGVLVQHVITPRFLGKVEGLTSVLPHLGLVCAHLGVPRSTFYAWRNAGRSLLGEKSGVELSPRERLLVDFHAAVERGTARKSQCVA